MKGLSLNKEEQKDLLKWLNSTIGSYFGQEELEEPVFLEEMPRCGVFVTLHLHGQLRGCIGFIQSDRILSASLRDAAHSAAFRDPRFPALTEEEWENTDLEVSILSPLEELDSPDDLILGKHGALIDSAMGRGLFLPQVAREQGWDKTSFMNQLCLKAGLSSDFWQRGQYKLMAFTAHIYS